MEYVGNPVYNLTKYEDPGDWTAFHTQLTAIMDTMPEKVTINYVYDENQTRGKIIYFRFDTTDVHELIVYWVD